jgi:periplasmic protein TonB
MKLDLFKNQWLDLVFDGRNKSYGAYDLRKTNSKVALKAFLIGGLIFAASVSAPRIFSKKDVVVVEDPTKSTTVKLAPKKVEIKKPVVEIKKAPASKVDIVKFVKPKITKAEEADKDPPPPPPPGKKTGEDDVKGNKDAPPPPLDVPTVTGGSTEKVEDPNKLYGTAGLEVKPEFAGGMGKFGEYVGKNFQTPEDAPAGKILMSFVVEKDGSLTDIKVIRDLGYGTGAEATRILKRCPKWKPGIQNGNPVRVSYTLPIAIEQASE